MKKSLKYLLGLSLTLALWTVFALQGTPSVAQMQSQKVPELSCVHLYPIMMKYLEKHVNWKDTSSNLEARAVEQFIKKLDGSKLYLRAPDVAKIEKSLKGIFAKTRKKDCSPIEKAHNLFEKRVKERVEYAKKYLGTKFKFIDQTVIELDPEKRKRFTSVNAQNNFHEKYMQYQVASYLMSDKSESEAKERVVKNYDRILKRVTTFEKTDLWAWYVDSFARALDPHSSYFSKDALEDFEIQMRLSLEGIGATLSSKDGFTVIEQLIPGGAAFKSQKLKRKDKIIAVGQGDKGAFKDVIEMDLRDVVRLIRGPKGSKVRLRIIRKAQKESKTFEVTLVRDKIKLEDEAASMTYLDRTIDGRKVKVGLLTLPSFYADSRRGGRSSASDMKRLLKEAKKKGVDAVVLDLSNNGGGSLEDAVEGAGLFFKKGAVVKQSLRTPVTSGQIRYELKSDSDEDVDYSGPLVVLVSRVSASASEIVSGALQDYKRAVVVGGDHTFGKGTVQSVEYLPPGLGAIKTTVGMFFTAGGNSTQHRGVDADIEFPSIYSTDEIGEKTLDYSLPPKKIPSFLSKEAYVKAGDSKWKLVTKDLIDKLKKNSKLRVASSEMFEKVKKRIKKNEGKRGKPYLLADLLKEKEEADKEEGGAEVNEEDEDDEGGYLTREERKKKYLERADVNEAVNIAADMFLEYQGVNITLGAAQNKPGSKSKETPTAN